jgi:23S rRNA (guanine745-N1)-methyltransferase
MLDDVAGCLACPQCGAGMSRDGAVLRCAAGHAFDIARQGYVSLLPPGGRAHQGDTAEMVQARADFLAAGHYRGLARELARTVAGALRPVPPGGTVPGCVVDVGAGTGYYLAAVLDELPGRAGLALDASKFALRRAARAHERIGAGAADAWHRLPVTDGAAAAVLNVFAPRDGAELRRILHPAGRLVVVTPDPAHLSELVGALGLLVVDPRKNERLAATLSPSFDLTQRRHYGTTLQLDHAGVAAAVAMGPSSRHTAAATLAGQIRQLPSPLPVTVSVAISVFRPRAARRRDTEHRGSSDPPGAGARCAG